MFLSEAKRLSKVTRGAKVYRREGIRHRAKDYVSFDTRIHEYVHPVMALATKDVACVTTGSSIMGAVEKMYETSKRRLPVIDAGSRRLEGIITATDIADLIGGRKAEIIRDTYKGNLRKMLNGPVSKIMCTKPVYITSDRTADEIMSVMAERGVGGLPVVDDEEKRKLVGLVSEADMIFPMAQKVMDVKVRDCCTRNVITASAGETIGDVAKTMVANNFCHMPVMMDDGIIGMISTMDIVRLIGSHEIFNMLDRTSGDVFSLPAGKFMSKKVITVAPEDDLGEVVSLMRRHDVGGFPVVKDNRLYGIISERDVLKQLV